MSSVAFIALGANLGDRQKNIESAIEKLKARRHIEVKQVSSIIETEAVGDTEQPKFLNAVCRIETLLYPDELLATLKGIERELGRDRNSQGARLTPEEQLKMIEKGDFSFDTEKAAPAEQVQHDNDRQKGSGPRTIDLDILFYDDIIMKGINLTIPHPCLHERFFVLKPLYEIAPDFMHPLLKKPVSELFAQCTGGQDGLIREA